MMKPIYNHIDEVFPILPNEDLYITHFFYKHYILSVHSKYPKLEQKNVFEKLLGCCEEQ